jgi:hypothetical protein
MPDLWYFTKNGKDRVGPLSFEQIQQLAIAGQIAKTDMLYRQGDSTWVRAETVDSVFPWYAAGLQKELERPPPPAIAEPAQFMARAVCAVERQWFSILFRRDAPTGVWCAEKTFKRGDAAESRYQCREFAGSFAKTDSYPGCPYCANSTVFQCPCGVINCMDGAVLSGSVVACSGCGGRGELGGALDKVGGSSEM